MLSGVPFFCYKKYPVFYPVSATVGYSSSRHGGTKRPSEEGQWAGIVQSSPYSSVIVHRVFHYAANGKPAGMTCRYDSLPT